MVKIAHYFVIIITLFIATHLYKLSVTSALPVPLVTYAITSTYPVLVEHKTSLVKYVAPLSKSVEPLPEAETSLSEKQKQVLEELVIGLKINYVETDTITTALKTHNNDILIPIADLGNFAIKPEYLDTTKATIDNKDYVNLSKLQDIDYKLDEESLVLTINFPFFAMQVQNVSVWNNNKVGIKGFSGVPIKSFFMNYDITATRQDKNFHVAGIPDLNYSTGYSSMNQTILLNKSFGAKTTGNTTNSHNIHVVRLDTSWTNANEDAIAQWRIGDSITNPSNWSGSTRFAGLQYSTNFSLRPNLITYPLVNFAGRADLPSALDVYANSQTIYKGPLRTGEFNLDNMPVAAGKGAIEIKQQDITGKIQTITIPYYIAPVLLKKDLVDHSFQIGTQRVKYGSISNKYQYLVTSFDYNKGINDHWTSGVHFDSMQDVFAIGASNWYQIGTYGVISAAVATSGPKLTNAQKLMLGYSFHGETFSLSIQQTISGKDFVNTFTLDTNGIKKSTQGSISYPLTEKSSVGLTYLSTLAQSDRARNNTKMISASYQTSLTQHSSLRFSASTDIKNKRNNLILLSFGINLGSNYVGTNVSRQERSWTKNVGISSNTGQHGTSYSANLTKNQDNKLIDYDAQIKQRLSKVDTTLYLFNYGNSPTQQIGLDGAVVVTSNGLFLTEPIHDSFAIAKIAKYKDVSVYHNNTFITKTDKNGVVFIPNIHSYVDSKIAIDENTLPLSAQFSDTEFIVNAKKHSGVIANFEVAKVHAAEMTLVSSSGVHIERDNDVKIDGLESELFVGYNGKIYIQNIKDLKQLNGSACKDGTCCHFNINIETIANLEILDLGVQQCH